MGGRGFRHQPPPERRSLSAAIARKYARVSPWLRPAAEVFRAATPPIHVGVRLHVSARTLRVPATAPAAVERQQRRTADAPPVAARLFERATRQTHPFERSIPGPAAPPVAFSTAAGPAPFRPPVSAPIAMVLARPAASGPAVATPRDVHEWRRPDEIRLAPAKAPIRGGEIDAAMTRGDVDRLADRVIGAIDRRMVAARERLHR